MNNPTKSRWYLIVVAATITILPYESGLAQTPKHVLVISVADGFVHSVIPTANQVLAQLAATSGVFTVDFALTDQALSQKMTLPALSNYDGVIFQNTTGELPLPDRDGFLAWIASGKGFMAVHSATATYPDASGTLPTYPAYPAMLGAQSQANTGQRTVTVFNRDSLHPATRDLGASFQVYDEIMLFQNIQWNEIHELLGMNQHPTTGAPGDYPLAWCRAYGSGRVFATALAHRADVWQSTWFQQHLLGGVRWMLKLDRGSLPRLVVEQPSFPGGSFAFHFDGAAVETYSVQASSNLVDWICISTNTAPSNTTYRILDSSAGAFSDRFYRVFLP